MPCHHARQQQRQRQGQHARARQRRSARPAPGARLADAFEAVERFPVLVESRARVMQAATAETARIGELIEAVESDVALTIAVLRFANRSGVGAGGVASVPDAVDILKPSGVLAIAGTAPVFDFFESNGGWELRPEHFRVHALATQRAADADRPRGRLGRPRRARRRRAPPRRRPARHLPPAPRPQELLRRRSPAPPSSGSATNATSSASTTPWSAACWRGAGTCRSGSPSRSSATTPRTPTAWPAMVAVADMVAHYSQGEAVSPERLRAAAERCGLGADGLRELLYELPYPRQDGPADQRALSALGPRARRPAPPLRGHGLQADRRRDAALGLDDPHPPAQRLRQDRRRRPGPGRPHRARPRLDLAAYSISDSRRAIATAWVRLRAPSRARMFLVWVLTVSSLRSELAGGDRGRFAVGEQLEDLALAAGQLAAAARRRDRGVDEALLGERGAGPPASAPRRRRCGRRRRWRRPAGRRSPGGARAARRGRRCRGSARLCAARGSPPSPPSGPSPSPSAERMSTIATSKLPTSRTSSTRLVAARALVDLEAACRARCARRAGRAGDRRSPGSVGARSGLLPIRSGFATAPAPADPEPRVRS